MADRLMGGGLSDGGGAYPRVVKTVNGGRGGLSDGGAYLRRGLIGRILRPFIYHPPRSNHQIFSNVLFEQNVPRSNVSFEREFV